MPMRCARQGVHTNGDEWMVDATTHLGQSSGRFSLPTYDSTASIHE